LFILFVAFGFFLILTSFCSFCRGSRVHRSSPTCFALSLSVL
jgi:hypothetical protein